MAENTFDALLRQALVEANWREWQPLWETAAEPDFSSGYRRWRLRLLADPFGWMKKRLRPLWVKTLRTAACLVLASAVVLGSLMAVSPTVRAAVLNWLREISGNKITYFSSEDNSLTADRTSWRPTWLPEGWVVTDIYSRSSRSWWGYKDSNGSGASLTCACFAPSSAESMTTIIDADDMDKAHTTVRIQAYTADLYEGENDILLVWEDQDGYLFWMSGWMIDQATIEQIANSMTYYQEEGIDYEVNWLPKGYELISQYESNGAAQNEWVKSGAVLTLQYITDPLCPWEESSREYELVDVSGVQAKYWPNLVSDEEAYLDSTEGSQFSFKIDYGIEKTAVLTWEDPDTNTIFRLRGVLNKEDILHMAESITGSEKNN